MAMMTMMMVLGLGCRWGCRRWWWWFGCHRAKIQIQRKEWPKKCKWKRNRVTRRPRISIYNSIPLETPKDPLWKPRRKLDLSGGCNFFNKLRGEAILWLNFVEKTGHKKRRRKGKKSSTIGHCGKCVDIVLLPVGPLKQLMNIQSLAT